VSPLEITALARAVHVGSVSLVLGTFVVALLVPRELEDDGARRLHTLVVRLVSAGLVGAVASLLAWLIAQSAVVTGTTLANAVDARAVGRLMTRTEFGRVSQVRALLVAVLGAVLVAAALRRGRVPRLFLTAGVLLAAATSGTLAWAGHASATDEAGVFHRTATAAHLIFAAAWLGGLVPLALLLGATGAGRIALDAVVTTVRRFSLIALLSVALIIVTGVVNAWFLVATWPALLATPYGHLLLVKLALFVPVLVLAAANRRRSARLGRAGADSPTVVRRLRRQVHGELAFGAAIIVVVGWLGITPPARHVSPAWPFSFRLSWDLARLPPDAQTVLATAGVVCLLGLVVCGVAWARGVRWALAFGLVMLAVGVWLGATPLAIDAYPTTYVRPAVTYHAASVARGAALYAPHCALCHGVSGTGDGPAAASLNQPPADLTAPHAADHTAGDMFWWLTRGRPRGPMPGFDGVLSEEDRWDVINLVRALAAAQQAQRLAAMPSPDTMLVAPDFLIEAGAAAGETLREQRGRSVIHLVVAVLPGSAPRLVELARAAGAVAAAGGRTVVALTGTDAGVGRWRAMGARDLALVTDGGADVARTFGLFARRTSPPDGPPVHAEFLIDRQGYVRARWQPSFADWVGWNDPAVLAQAIERLAKEPPRAPPPEEHVH